MMHTLLRARWRRYAGWFRRRAGWILLLALVAWFVTPRAIVLARDWNHVLLPSWRAPVPDVDTKVIHDGLVSHPRFVDTLSWWWGPWVAGRVVPFYRPVPSLLFWVEWKAFDDHELRYSVVNLVVHVLVAMLLFVTSRRLIGLFGLRRPDLVVAAVVYGFFTGWHGLDTTRFVANDFVLCAWKNLPDALCATFALLSLYCYLRRLDGGRRAWMGAAVASYLLASGSKETGSVLPIAFLVLEFILDRRDYGEQRRERVRRIAAWCASVVLFQTARLVCLGGVGFQYGSNRDWYLRLISDALPPIGPLVTIRNIMPLITAATAWFSLLFVRSRYDRAFTAEAILTFLCLWFGVLIPLCWFTVYTPLPVDPWWVAAAACALTPLIQWWPLVCVVMLFPWVIVRGWREAPGLVAFGYAWVLLTAGPNAASPGPLHRQYLVGIGFCIAFAPGMASLAEDMAEWVRGIAIRAADNTRLGRRLMLMLDRAPTLQAEVER